MVEYKNVVTLDSNMNFWKSQVYMKGAGTPSAVFYGETQSQARDKGDTYISSQTAGGRGKQFIGDNGEDDDGYQTITEVLAAFNNCELTFRQASAEMKKINPSLSDNDLQNIIIDENPSVPDCDGDGVPSGEDTDGDLPPADDYSWWPLTEENRFMLIGVIVIYALWTYGRE